MMITRNFSTDEMMCHCGCMDSDMDSDFMKQLQEIRDEMKRPLKISSGVRCEKHNQKVSSTGKNGPHVHRKAVDIIIAGADALRLIDVARKHGMSGIGISQRGPHSKRFIHMDSLTPDGTHPRPTVWSYA